MTDDTFEDHRLYLQRLAYRMLGGVADAEDAVQETFLRWRQAGEPELREPRAWFTRACTRLCLDRIKSAQRQREDYVGEWLPEPLIEGAEVEGAARHELDETLSMALLRTVQQLPATERASFLLHDVFGYEFSEVATILELQPAHCRQLAVRARQHLRGERQRPADAMTVQRLSDAFFSAIRAGDMAALQQVLAEDVVLYSDGGGKAAAARVPVIGAAKVAKFFVRVFAGESTPQSLESLWFNGAPGVLVLQEGQPVSAFQFEVVDHRIVGVYVQRNPDKLRSVSR